jgi:hypothetical protein
VKAAEGKSQRKIDEVARDVARCNDSIVINGAPRAIGFIDTALTASAAYDESDGPVGLTSPAPQLQAKSSQTDGQTAHGEELNLVRTIPIDLVERVEQCECSSRK